MIRLKTNNPGAFSASGLFVYSLQVVSWPDGIGWG